MTQDPPRSKDRKSPGLILDPVDRFSEILFGLLMVLTFTGSLSAATARRDVHAMLLGALGCNLAWGIVDAVMYLLDVQIEKAHSTRLWWAIHSEPDSARARAIVQDELPNELNENVDSSLLDRLCDLVRKREQPSLPGRLNWTDVRGSLAVFLLMFVSTLPVSLPFLLVQEPWLAMRISNAVAVICLFLTGYAVGRYAGFRPWRMGVGMVLLGAVLVSITMALGG